MSDASCYYPNGVLAVGDNIPCGSGSGVACCPLNWKCQDNGLCYLPNQNYFGRYTCTDQSWQSSGCPQICTYNNTAWGDEAVLQCSPGSYCCDTNRPDVGCCDTTTARFGLDNNKKAISSVGSQPSASPAAQSAAAQTSSSSNSSPNAGSSPSSTSSSTGANGSPVQVVTSIITQAGQIETVVTTSTPSPQHSSKSSSSTIVPAVVVPIVAILIGALIFLFFRIRRKRQQEERDRATAPMTAAWGAEPMYKSGADDGSTSSPTTPYGATSGASELQGSTPDLHSPASGQGTHNGGGSEPSPMTTYGAHSGHNRAVSGAPSSIGEPGTGYGASLSPEDAVPRRYHEAAPVAELPGSTVGGTLDEKPPIQELPDSRRKFSYEGGLYDVKH